MSDSEISLLIDRLDIREVLLRHCAYFDEGNISGFEEVWAPDCVDVGHGAQTGHQDALIGRDALLDRIKGALGRFHWTHHHLGDSIIDIHGDEATAMTPVACWHEFVGGKQCWGTARYYNELRRTGGGRWLITHRRMVLTGAEGSIAERGGTWLARSSPTDLGSAAE